MARLTDIEDYNRDYVSDGVTVWYWEVTSEEIDTTFIHLVRISYLTHWPFIEHPVCNAQYSTFAVLYDDANALIWILKDSPSTTDTAWGYTTGGILDTIVSLTNIAVDAIYHGQWLHNTSEDVFFRRAELIPFTGGSSTPIGPFPVELTRQFAGGAGVGYPGVANYNAWTINVFDTLGNWIARQPIPISGDEVVYGAKVLVAGRRVIYQVRSTNGLYIRALQPE